MFSVRWAVALLGLWSVTAVAMEVPPNTYFQSYAETAACAAIGPFRPVSPTPVESQLLRSRWWIGAFRTQAEDLEIRQAGGAINDRCGLDRQQWFVFRQGQFVARLLPRPLDYAEAPRRAVIRADGSVALQWVTLEGQVTSEVVYRSGESGWSADGPSH